MTFAWPHLLWLLALPAGLLVWELVRIRRLSGTEHPKILRAEAGLSGVSLTEASSKPPFSSRRRFLLCAGLALGIVAIARPQWGRLDEPVFDQSREIIIALDLSRSMLTPDVKPSRLERSKLLIQSLLDHLKGERVGLVVFSGTAFLQAPLSADYEILREFLPSLGPDYLPEGGTNYRQLIDTSIEAFGESAAADRYLIILSDGEATDDDWKSRVPELEKKGIRVIGLGVGTSGGGMIPDGAGAFMKDENGAVVLSRLEDGTLRELTSATHGVYRDASEWVDLPRVLASTVDEGRKGRFVEHNSVRYVERYQWALAQALACLLASFWLEFPVRPKSRAIRLSAPAKPKARAAQAVAVASLLLLMLAGAAGVSFAADAPAEAPNPAAALSKIVGRLSAQDAWSAVDWSELGRETVSWGQHLKSSSQPVPEGPVRDALAAVDRGEKADPKATDWPHMRSELEDLIKKPPQDQKKDQQQNQDQDQKKDQDQKQDQKQDQRDQKQDQQKDQKDSPQQDQKSGKPQDSKDQSKPQPKSGEPNQADKDGSLGSMHPSPTPTPEHRESQSPMQKVGGVKKDQAEDPARNDPELAVPLEKLEQLKSQDSPAELFEMMRSGEPIPTPTNTGKNW
jgi:Ca-activated chloride channel family protein